MHILQVEQDTSFDIETIKAEILRRYLITKKGRTLYVYSRNLNKFFGWCNDNGHDNIRPDIIASYKIELEAAGLKPNSINTYLAPIRDFFGWCYDFGYMSYNAARGVKNVAKREINRARALSQDEVTMLFNATNKSDKRNRHIGLSIKLLFTLGLRVSEVTGIKVDDIDLLKGTIRINGKGGKLRVLGLNEYTHAEVSEHIEHFNLEGDDYLIGSVKTLRGNRISTQHMARTLKELCQKADIDPDTVKSHSGRVSAINFLLDKDVPIRDVANFAGHKDTATTMIYDRKSQDKIVQTCNIIDYSRK